MRYITILLSAILLCISACDNHTKNPLNPLTIVVQPFSDFKKEEIAFTYKAIKKVYPFVKLNAPIELPKSSFYAPRNRFRADSIIIFLRKFSAENQVTIGLTAKDISVSKNGIQDWGIMGLGFCPGNACIVSTFRLTKQQKLTQLYKVCLHELGHTQGLPHCAEKYCFMRDAEGGNPINQETDFCPHCKNFLINKGWHFK